MCWCRRRTASDPLADGSVRAGDIRAEVAERSRNTAARCLTVTYHLFHEPDLLFPEVLWRAASQNVRRPLRAGLRASSEKVEHFLVHRVPGRNDLVPKLRVEGLRLDR